jgi:methionine-rich copper-binding protein CopC
MFKRMTILAILSLILIALMLMKTHTNSPVTHSSTKSSSPTAYTTMEYTITKITGKQYYGKADDGTGIQFSANNIVSGDKIQVNDHVICYFEKNNLGKGLVKVEKK